MDNIIKDDWKNYALIGSRQTPIDVCQLMSKAAYYMAQDGWTMRSGGAEGADKAGQDGSEQYAIDVSQFYNVFQEIYLPWNGFNGLYENNEKGYYVMNHSESENIAKTYHPVYDRLSKGGKKLIIRNGYQILGKKLNHPVNLVICWTKDKSYGNTTSKETGGTGHALRIAYDHDISIYNLATSWDYDRLDDWVRYKQSQNDFIPFPF